MSEIKTCEQKVLAVCAELEKRNAELEKRVNDLKKQLEEKKEARRDEGEEEPTPREVRAWRIDEPIELCYYTLASSYNYTGEHGLGMSASEIRDAVGDPEAMEELAKKSVGSYSRSKLLDVVTILCPFRIVALGQTYGVETVNESIYNHLVCRDEKPLRSSYYPSRRRAEVYAAGLSELSERLLSYAEVLENE